MTYASARHIIDADSYVIELEDILEKITRLPLPKR